VKFPYLSTIPGLLERKIAAVDRKMAAMSGAGSVGYLFVGCRFALPRGAETLDQKAPAGR
jgi:hypothetical protein